MKMSDCNFVSQDVSMDGTMSDDSNFASTSSWTGIATSEPMDDKEKDEDIESYYFESDHLAFRGNSDYNTMLKTIALLEAQRIQAIADIEKLHECMDDALKSPIEFVNKLQHGVDLGLPKAQQIAELPEINWEKYTSSVDFSSFGFPKHVTRLRKQLVEGPSNPECLDDSVKVEGNMTLVRGRVKGEDKTETFNKLWTAEEQKRLEELLVEFPPEEVEAKRWAKIANALGNRTPIQVASRVQKYFIKLAKAGLPIPGRLPNIAFHRPKHSHRHQRFQKFYYQPSTFLTSHEPPVYMSDDENNSESFYGGDESKENFLSSGFDNSDNDEDPDEDELIPIELRNTPEYEELMQLKKLKHHKMKVKREVTTKHFGFKCDGCNCDPIIGTRWHCQDCDQEDCVDFCEKCVNRNIEVGQHNSSHRLTAVTKDYTDYGTHNSSHHPTAVTKDSADSDYGTQSFMPEGYNYLDPNYMPAT
ncbi:ZZ-type zinc finger-containing protein 3-like [Saccostrea echinata]|uniref:ZZ-type zinc finger-containing protein 3-like n=1 Tax=Saccostrea echinata TaxID=191078 RepID=UPI002A8141DE|nr:ZZ-type zinc finger-containing protein 3-like [Saccostrea echinata]